MSDKKSFIVLLIEKYSTGQHQAIQLKSWFNSKCFFKKLTSSSLYQGKSMQTGFRFISPKKGLLADIV